MRITDSVEYTIDALGVLMETTHYLNFAFTGEVVKTTKSTITKTLPSAFLCILKKYGVDVKEV